MRFSTSVAVLASAGAVFGQQTFQIVVGNNSELTFSPNSITGAQTGDTLQFIFATKNHTATQSSFTDPCTELAPPPGQQAINSGFMPVPAGTTTGFPTFNVQLTNVTAPLWFYCQQTIPADHCQLGMVFAVNPTADKTFALFQQMAMGSAAATSNTTTASNSTSSASSISLPTAPASSASTDSAVPTDSTDSSSATDASTTSAASSASGAAASSTDSSSDSASATSSDSAPTSSASSPAGALRVGTAGAMLGGVGLLALKQKQTSADSARKGNDAPWRLVAGCFRTTTSCCAHPNTVLSHGTATHSTEPACSSTEPPSSQTPKTQPVQPLKSPTAARTAASKFHRGALRGSRRPQRIRQTLPTIVEEDEEEEDVAQTHIPKHDVHRELDAYMREDDVEMMEWDEETTLVALFQDDATDAGGEEDLAALAEKLRAPMSARSQQLKQYMAETVVPVIQRVRQVHETLDEEGLLTFDEMCKRVEAMALRTEDETKTVYLESQKTMRLLMDELADAYRHRAQLWVDMEAKLADCATRAKTALEGIPADVEETIARLEKKSKDMEKNSTSAASKQKMLKGLLERL
ncbi:hypothetical protein EIP86_004361 [Pleurotus ostreatoroseus]|nr:hypothetical protein EIP86_004361 [Pleurotus ostreatoroseus]